MKKTLLLVVLLALSVSAGAQNFFNFSSNRNRLEVGLAVGKPGLTTAYEDWGWGASVVLCGLQVDYIQAGPAHKFDNHVTDEMWDDQVACALNVGYQIPVLPWLRITPIVGYCQTNYGKTDGSSINVSWSESSATLYHDYNITPGSQTHYFNFGGGISISPFKWLSISGVYSRYAVYGAIAFNFAAM